MPTVLRLTIIMKQVCAWRGVEIAHDAPDTFGYTVRIRAVEPLMSPLAPRCIVAYPPMAPHSV
jgi:hypothetical protein